jgi:hypothetical protein
VELPDSETLGQWIEAQVGDLHSALQGEGGQEAVRALFAEERLKVAADGTITGVAVLELDEGSCPPGGSGGGGPSEGGSGAEPLWCPGLGVPECQQLWVVRLPLVA